MSIAAAPTIWTLPAQFDVLDLISYVRRSSILLHHQSKTGGTLPELLPNLGDGHLGQAAALA